MTDSDGGGSRQRTMQSASQSDSEDPGSRRDSVAAEKADLRQTVR